MFNVHKQQRNVNLSHPLVRHAYFKKGMDRNRRGEDVLVLETYGDEGDIEFAGFDSYLVDLLKDLQNLKDQAERKVGSIDRIDIRRH